MSRFGKIAILAALAVAVGAGGAFAYDTCYDCPSNMRGKRSIPLRKKKVRCRPCDTSPDIVASYPGRTVVSAPSNCSTCP